MRPCILISLSLLASSAAYAQQQPAQIDYPAFAKLTDEVADYREKRLIGLEDFNKKRAQDNVIILDTRSTAAFARGHVRGAINLPFSDFTDAKLAAVLGEDKNRPILIYCNNNFRDDAVPVILKRAPLALNIPTFINLYGYGYKNIYELSGSYYTKEPEVNWVSG